MSGLRCGFKVAARAAHVPVKICWVCQPLPRDLSFPFVLADCCYVIEHEMVVGVLVRWACQIAWSDDLANSPLHSPSSLHAFPPMYWFVIGWLREQ